MRLISPAFHANQPIPIQFTCDGRDVNPALRLEDVPADAGSLALVVDDPDAPGGTWIHWTLWNLDPVLREIPEDTVPKGAVQGMTDNGTVGWGGPCPPPGKAHHYRFRVFALRARLPLPAGAAARDLLAALEGQVIAKSELIGTYRRGR